MLQDEDGDWYETGLHIFFGAYPNMMNVFKCASARAAVSPTTLMWRPSGSVMPGLAVSSYLFRRHSCCS